MLFRSGASMVRRAPFPLSRIPASIAHSMKLLCVCITTTKKQFVPKYLCSALKDPLRLMEAIQVDTMTHSDSVHLDIFDRGKKLSKGQERRVPMDRDSRQGAPMGVIEINRTKIWEQSSESSKTLRVRAKL